MAANRMESLPTIAGISSLSNSIREHDSDACYLCRSDILHTLTEHAKAVKNGTKVETRPKVDRSDPEARRKYWREYRREYKTRGKS